MDNEQSAELLEKASAILENMESLEHAQTEPVMRQFVETSGFSAGQVFGIMRVAITGQKVSPPLFESVEIIGKITTLARLKQAINLLRA